MKLLAILFIAACGAAQSPASSSAPVASVSFDNPFNLIFLDVSVAGSPPRTFLLDSGADETILDLATARELGIAVTGQETSAQPGGEVAIAHARDVTFRVGGAPFTAPDVWVTPLAGLHRFVGRRFDGLLGHAFLERYATRISYADHRIELYEPARFAGTGASVPVEIVAAEAFVHVTLDTGAKQVDARLKLDTGSLDTLGLNGSFVQAQALFPEGHPRVARQGVGFGGGLEGFWTRIPSLAIGGFTLGPMPIGFSAETKRGGDAGTLGAEILRRFTVTFDYTRKRLLLEPNGALRDPFPMEASGMFGATFEGDFQRFVVLDVTPDAPAARGGVVVGDEILSVDGTQFASYGLPRLWARVHQPGPLRLTVRRDGAEKSLDLTLRPLL